MFGYYDLDEVFLVFNLCKGRNDKGLILVQASNLNEDCEGTFNFENPALKRGGEQCLQGRGSSNVGVVEA